ncbi:hypothetical protein K4L04_03955 [Phaeobacter inhibens]|uniref:hypothetical protein n=1 Tax=Phaeobacter inhibens TaxID=221822 RepID=UPI0021A7E77C|nr:hypothetical protein [Phaeobacter inhibens]UWR77122.1 hypothetical protein K4L04_03955 [Phaeobacter inhibens]
MAEIKTKIFKKNFTSTPRRISDAIERLCKEINPGATPETIRVKPDAGAQPSECFFNVAERIKRDGGTMVYGWSIWEWPRVFIEAEHHAVWEKNGTLVDITPHANRERRILFLRDPSADYDFEGHRRRINIKRSLGRFESVDRWLAAADEFQHAVEDNSVGRLSHFDPTVMHSHQHRMRDAWIEVLLDLAYQTKPRDRCICASGLEYRKCCSKLISFQA